MNNNSSKYQQFSDKYIISSECRTKFNNVLHGDLFRLAKIKVPFTFKKCHFENCRGKTCKYVCLYNHSDEDFYNQHNDDILSNEILKFKNAWNKFNNINDETLTRSESFDSNNSDFPSLSSPMGSPRSIKSPNVMDWNKIKKPSKDRSDSKASMTSEDSNANDVKVRQPMSSNSVKDNVDKLIDIENEIKKINDSESTTQNILLKPGTLIIISNNDKEYPLMIDDLCEGINNTVLIMGNIKSIRQVRRTEKYSFSFNNKNNTSHNLNSNNKKPITGLIKLKHSTAICKTLEDEEVPLFFSDISKGQCGTVIMYGGIKEIRLVEIDETFNWTF
jgi:hypothetical protein